MEKDLNHIKKQTKKLYKTYKRRHYFIHSISILLNIFTVIVCPIIILLDYYKVTNIVVASSVLGFINNIVFNLSGLQNYYDKKAKKCLKLETVIIKNSFPTQSFLSLCKRELRLIKEPKFRFKKDVVIAANNTSNTAEEMYQIDRYIVFETNQ